jgi:hypothetical protein
MAFFCTSRTLAPVSFAVDSFARKREETNALGIEYSLP